MIDRRDSWTTRELELFHDGELGDEARTSLVEDLRRDPALRERLASVRRVDDQARACLQRGDDSADRSSRSRTRPAVSKWRLAAAAIILLVLTGTWQLSTRPAGWHLTEQREDSPERTVPEGRGYDAIRVVFSLPSPAKKNANANQRADDRADVGTDSTVVESADRGNRVFLERLNRMLAAGRYGDTTRLIGGATNKQRSVAYAYLGELLRSADLAERILDQLSPREQLAACEVWARTPGLTALVFKRLEKFSTQPEYADEMRAVLARFNEDPILRRWVRASQLRT